MSWLKLQSVSKSNAGQEVLRNFNLEIEKGIRLGIAGETGSGKTTLLKIIAGLIQPDSGTVTIGEERVLGPDEKLLPGHPQIAYLSQHFELLHNYRVEEVLDLKNLLSVQGANEIYQLCEIEHLLKRKTTAISGGERQRIALAKALVTKPQLLLLDEPFSNLDPGHKRAMKQLLTALEKELGLTLIMVSHDGSDLLSWSDSILLLQNGQIVQDGSPDKVYSNPISEYCAGLMGEYSVLWEIEPGLYTAEKGPDRQIRYLRPEEFEIFWEQEVAHPNAISSKQVMAPLKGIIEEVLYLGGFSLLQVRAGQQLLTVRHLTNDCKPGQAVYVSVLRNQP